MKKDLIEDKVDPWNFEKLSGVNSERHYEHFYALLECLALQGRFDIACSLAYNEATHYKHLAQIDGIRDKSNKYAEELLSKSKEYGEKFNNNS